MNLENIEYYQRIAKIELQLVNQSLEMEQNFSNFLVSQKQKLKEEKRKPYSNMWCVNHLKQNIKEYKENIKEQKTHTATYRRWLENSERIIKRELKNL